MRAFIGSVVALLLLASPVRAYVPEETPARRIEGAARTLGSTGAVRASRSSVIVSRGGRTIYSSGTDAPMRPASVIKLFTTTAAMVRFGPTHRFRTSVKKKGNDLVLVGGGDPTFSTEAYRRARFLPKPTDAIKRPAFETDSPTVEDLAAAVHATGVRAVGRVIADESLFDTVRTQRGWPARYLGRDPLTGLLGALTINEGRADLKGLVLEKDPPRATLNAFIKALRARGISVAAGAVGRSPAGAEEIAHVDSPPMSQLVDFINRYSINFGAEILLKHLGVHRSGRGTTAAGVAEVRAVMRELKVPVDGLAMADGSGLSTVNLVRPSSVAALLRHIVAAATPEMKALKTSIPKAGGPGTMRRRGTAAPARGNLQAKTGTVLGVRAFAGWTSPMWGAPVVFVLIFNSAPNVTSFNSPFDLFGGHLSSI